MPRGSLTVHDLYLLAPPPAGATVVDVVDDAGDVEWTGPIADLWEMNDPQLTAEEVEKLRAIDRGEVDELTLGGGAAPVMTVRRHVE